MSNNLYITMTCQIMILGNRDEWQPVLLKLIDDDQLPVSYGGTLPGQVYPD